MLADNFPTFRFLSVTRPAPNNTVIRWTINPTSYNLANIVFEVFKSYSPEGPWELMGEVSGKYDYLDSDSSGNAVTRLPYYKVRAADIEGKGFLDSNFIVLQHDPDNIAIELVRKKLVFMRVKSGIEWAVLKRKSYGAKCARCFNEVRRVCTDADCTECYGTGYAGGYLTPVYVPGIFNPHQATIVEGGLTYEPFNIYAEFANYPYIDMKDVIVDGRMNIRYEVMKVGYTARRGYTVSQVVTLNRLDNNSILYTIKVEPPVNTKTGESYYVEK